MTREIRVGLMLVAGALVLVIGVFLVGDQEGIWKSKYHLKIRYDNIYGLLTGAPVRLAGLRVGTVTDIEFSEAEGGVLEVTISIDKEVKRRIRADSKAFIGTLGLLGDKTIEISAGSPEYMVLEENEYLQAGRSASIEAIVASGGEAMDNITDMTMEAKEIIGKINDGVGSLGLFVNDPDIYFDLDRLLILTEKLTGQIESGKGSFARFLKDPAFYDELTQFLHLTNSTIDSLTSPDGTIGKLMRDPQAYENLNSILANWKILTDRLIAGEGAAGQLLTSDSLYLKLNYTLERTAALMEDFQRNPGRYIKLRIF